MNPINPFLASGSLAGAGITMMLLFILGILIFLGIFVFLFVFWIWMIIDCVKRKFKNENDKIVWILVLIFLSFLGAILYYFIVKRQ